LAQCVSIVEKDDQLDSAKKQTAARFYSDQALAMLRDAVSEGFNDAVHMKKGRELAPLRNRDEFHKLLAEVETRAKTPSAAPGQP